LSRSHASSRRAATPQGSSVLVEDLGGGELRILPTDKVRERVRQVADRLVAQHPEAMDILANYDPDDENAPA
jgi:hypothetical protein